ncbi:MAG TPA: DNA-binding response regulator [Verrucomicrobiales bacterium]|nr:DNA-binding response regulator [Verrucomicrobiales bacterium]
MSTSPAPSQQATVLVVDDIPANRNVLRQTLESDNYEVLLASDGATALHVAAKAAPDVILLDVMMPGIDGFETCRQLKAGQVTRNIPVIFISAQSETRSMIEGFQVGGVDYITKPFKAEEVLVRVRTHLTNHRLTREVLAKNQELEKTNARLREEIERRQMAESSLELADAKLSLISERETRAWGLEAFVGRSPAMQEVIAEIRRLQLVDNTSVLIKGESGTGKELVARALHHSGRRSTKPFITVNCAAIPAELAESLFFGHVKGAFSGATGNRKGYFEMADEGTLFLDEIGDMPPVLQAKLLRAIEDGSFMPVGSSAERHADVRLLTATNADLDAKTAAGTFREDLYFRIKGYEICLKPLRERLEDIQLFTTHFLSRFAEELNIPVPVLSSEAGKALHAYHFPGNVRELKSILERALIESGGGTIEEFHLHLLNEKAMMAPVANSEPVGTAAELPLNLELAELELARRALAEANGNVSKAAQLLGINRTKVYRILSQQDSVPTDSG